MTNQTLKSDEIEIDIDPCNTYQDEDAIEKEDDSLSRESNRQYLIYRSSQKDVSCIICNEKKKENHGKDVKLSTMTFRNIEE